MTSSASYSNAMAMACLLLLAPTSHGWLSSPATIARARPSIIGTSTDASSTRLCATTDSSKDPVEMARLRMEMHWGMSESAQECVVEDPKTCGSDECTTCQGKGMKACRFCRGTRQVFMGAQFMACPICNANGLEECHSCTGTGWVAEWTHLADDKNNNEEETTFLP